MRGPSASRVRWLLLSDLHFQQHDLDRVQQTANWIVAEAARNQVKRVVVCGDLLTSCAMRPTHVLSACYRFISNLIDVVPLVHILLGKHDLAYRRDYQTTALDALNIKRLAPYVSLHSAVARHEWDGRRVLLLPFREEQNELTEAVAALRANEASNTVAFAHLAINKAITQRYVVKAGVDNPRAAKSITYHGLIGPDSFASLARTFTGHFHSHQIITQKQPDSDKTDLRGSITYIGSPLQLDWADLYDEQRGVILFDPETLEQELLINPHAVGYRTADLQQVFDGHIDKGAVEEKHVMILGKPTQSEYLTARDKLRTLGVRRVGKWVPRAFGLEAGRSSFNNLGASVPACHSAVQPLEKTDQSPEMGSTATTNNALGNDPSAGPEDKSVDFATEVRKYVESLDLNQSLYSRRDELVRVGQRMIQASRESVDQDRKVNVNYQDFLNGSYQPVSTGTATEMTRTSFPYIFVAEPRKLTITNFLGVQGTLTIDFREDIPHGLTFLLGDNGSGKSTLLEAVTWCHFGKCIRNGVAVNDVVNDNVGKDCSITLEFANGYAITRYRKHKTHNNRVFISRDGDPQTQLEHSNTRGVTQAAINELLGIDYKTYKLTAVLSHESAASFLSATPAQWQDLIVAALGLSRLDQCGKLAELSLENIDHNLIKVEADLDSVARGIKRTEGKFKSLQKKLKEIEDKVEKAFRSSEAAAQDNGAKQAQTPNPEMGSCAEILEVKSQIEAEEEKLQRLEISHRRMQEQMPKPKNTKPTSWLGRLQGTSSSQSHEQTEAMKDSCRKMEESRSRLKSLKEKERLTIDHAVTVSELAKSTIRAQTARETLQQKQNEAAKYKGMAEAEQSSLSSLRSEHDTLAAKRRGLAADRELFLFWSSAMAKGTPNTSSPSSKERAIATFREHMLRKSRPDLEYLLTQALTVLYDDTRHAQGMATGMLSSLFNWEESDLFSDTTSSVFSAGGKRGRVFDATVPSLSYNKRSSGERKRVDLAFFFVLLQLARARSAYRAHYVLVDEVFDNLDGAGQAAVARWCEVMTQAEVVGWIVVITHSRLLAEQERDLGVEGGKGLVVEVKMGEKGTELEVGGRRIGGG